MNSERTISKRSREEIKIDPNKRSQSPRNSFLFYGNTFTPTKSKPDGLRGSKLFNSLRNVFIKSRCKSPVSEYKTPHSSLYIEEPSSEERDTSFTSDSPTSLSTTSSSFYSSTSPTSSLFFDNVEVESSFHSLSIHSAKTHQIFTIPEIVIRIISYIDCHTSLPCEESPLRRRPLSYKHALLIHKDEKKAKRIWKESLNSITTKNDNPKSKFPYQNNLFNCMLVSKLWYHVTLELANTKVFFSSEIQWNNFVNYTQKIQRKELKCTSSNTKVFILHEISYAKQEQIEIVAPSISGNLEWIEMYICPRILPTIDMLSGSMLKKLIIPGSKVVHDRFLKMVSKNCPLLEILDLRACPLVSDQGLIHVTTRCPELQVINVGRHSRFENITDLSLITIARHCKKISTLGFAGCSITDRGLWEIAIASSDTIQRLSLNNCVLLTNGSIPRIISNGFFQNLSVLEMRHVLALTEFNSLIQFKRTKERLGHTVLIEGCEVLEYRMREEEWRLDMSNSAKMLNDIQAWVSSNDCDADYRSVYNDMK